MVNRSGRTRVPSRPLAVRLLPAAAVMLLLAAAHAVAQPDAAEPASEPELVTEVSRNGGTTALVLNLEARLHFLRATDVPVLNGIFTAVFADGGLFRDAARSPATAGDFTVGGALGIDWQSISVAVEAGYHHADAGFVWGVELKSFR